MNKKYIQLSVFLFLMIFGLFLRVYHIGKFSLFGDEKQSILLAVGNTNIGGMVELMNPEFTFTPADFWKPRGIQAWLKADASGDVSGNSLLHDMSLKLTSYLFGKSDGAFRSLSVFFNMLTILLLYIWAKKIYPNLNWVIVVLVLAVIEPFFIIFSQQARNYTTSLFFTTLSNYYFWMIMQSRDLSTIKNKYFIGWVIGSIGSLFSTYLTALVLIGQLIYTIFNWPRRDIVVRFIIGSLLVLIPFTFWMTLGPGQYFLNYQADAAQQYRDFIANNGPIPGWIEASTPMNLFKRTITIVSDQFIWTNDLYTTYGYKIGAILLIFFGFSVSNWLKSLSKSQRQIYLLGILQIILPVIVLFFSAIHAKTTTGFFLRYASFGLPFGIFISVGLLKYLFEQNVWIKILTGIFLLVQVYTIIGLITPLYKDKKQKYTFSVNRIANPYPLIAEKIRRVYQSGDTVYYPSKFNNFLNSKHISQLNVDVVDAQLVNLYLEPQDHFIQRIDLKLKDSILIKGRNGRRLLIFDFQNGKYRY
jgi:hypothetical protein